MKVIVPCCGRSSRFPNQPPKWMLPAHDGRPMIVMALAGVECSLDDVVIAILREHEDQFHVRAGLRQAFGRDVQVLIHEEPTRSQAETVARTIEKAKLREPFLIKDSDNAFTLSNTAEDHNYVCVESLNHFDSINPRNKSYVQVDHNNVVTNIREKVVISDLFNVGGYYFCSPDQFVETYARLEKNTSNWNREIYISDVIGAMILDGIPFRAREVSGYQDWGTLTEWQRALVERRGYLVAVDGFVFEKGNEHFHPRFDDVRPNEGAIQSLRSLANAGHSVLYYSIRPASLSALTERQLAAASAPPGPILYGCPIAPLVIVAAPDATLRYGARTMELAPKDEQAFEKLSAER